MPDLRVLLIEPDEKTAGFLQHMLKQAGHRVTRAPSGKEGLILSWRDQPDVVILELDLPDIDGADVVTKLRKDRRTARTPILALTTRSAPEHIAAGLQAGLTDYVVKQADAVDTLMLRLASLPRGEGAPPPEPSSAEPGRLVVFLSANGGAGTSSLCLNMAYEFARLGPGSRVCVVDMVLPLGSLAHLTGCDPRTDLVALTRLPEDEVTPDELRHLLPTPRSWELQLLPGSADPIQASELQAERIPGLVRALRGAFDFVFIDIGRNLSSLAMSAAAQADALALVFVADPSVLSNTRALMSFLDVEEIPPEKLFLISNLPSRAQSLGGTEWEKELGRAVDGAIHNMGENLSLANSQHLPLSLRFGEDRSTDSLRQTAAKLLARLQI